MINNQTTNFTILSRIWNHDFYITQKSNFCTAGHKYLNKRRVFCCGKHIFQTGFYSQLKQFSSWLWSNVDVISLRLRWLYYRSEDYKKINGGTLLGEVDWRKEKETKEILPIYLSSRSSARCLLRWALRILFPNSYDFPEFVQILIRDTNVMRLTLFKQAFSSCPLRKTEDKNGELSKMEGCVL